MPKSPTQRNQKSSITPSVLGGASMTQGPSARLMLPQKYTVSALAVRNSDVESISSENSRNSLSPTPTSAKPRRNAHSDTPWIELMKAVTPCTNCISSRTFSADSTVG
jgi:hypothetical protein